MIYCVCVKFPYPCSPADPAMAFSMLPRPYSALCIPSGKQHHRSWYVRAGSTGLSVLLRPLYVPSEYILTYLQSPSLTFYQKSFIAAGGLQLLAGLLAGQPGDMAESYQGEDRRTLLRITLRMLKVKLTLVKLCLPLFHTHHIVLSPVVLSFLSIRRVYHEWLLVFYSTQPILLNPESLMTSEDELALLTQVIDIVCRSCGRQVTGGDHVLSDDPSTSALDCPGLATEANSVLGIALMQYPTQAVAFITSAPSQLRLREVL